MKSIQAMREIDRRLSAAKKAEAAAPKPPAPWYVRAAAACAPVMAIGFTLDVKS